MPNSRYLAALRQLDLLRDERQKYARQERLYVKLAYVYGCTVPQISMRTGIPLRHVREILLS